MNKLNCSGLKMKKKKNGTEASNLKGIHVLFKEIHEPTCKVFIHKAPFKQHKRQ